MPLKKNKTRSGSVPDEDEVKASLADVSINNISKKLSDIAADLPVDSPLITISEAIRIVLVNLEDLTKLVCEQSKTHKQILDENKHQTQKIESLVKELSECKSEIHDLKKENTELLIRMNDTEQYSRKNNIEIHGVPETDNEDLDKVIIKIADCFGFSVTSQDIEVAHRLGKNNNKTTTSPPIVAKFFSRKIKDKFVEGKKVKKTLLATDLGFTTSGKIFVNEHLTKVNKNLFWLTRKAKVDLNYKFAWVKGGKIYLRKNEQATVIRIAQPSDIPCQ